MALLLILYARRSLTHQKSPPPRPCNEGVFLTTATLLHVKRMALTEFRLFVHSTVLGDAFGEKMKSYGHGVHILRVMEDFAGHPENGCSQGGA